MSTRVDTSSNISSTELGPVVTTRVDARHVANHATDQSEAASAASADELTGDQAVNNPADLSDAYAQLEHHARQLGLELDRRQDELDEREEELNARLAEFDKEMRTSRLWVDERRQELEERAAQLDQHRQDQASRLERIVAAEAELHSRRAARVNGEQVDDVAAPISIGTSVDHVVFVEEARRRGEALAASHDQLRERAEDRIAELKASLQAARSQLAAVEERATAAERRLAELPLRDADLNQRSRQLDESEALLYAEWEYLAKKQRELAVDRQTHAEQQAADRRALERLRNQQEEEFTRRKRPWIEQGRQLDARAESLEQLRRELAATQRETLEMRIATQEAWLQLSGRMAPAALTQTFAETRGKLAQHYHDARRDLEAMRDELHVAAERLAAQVEQLKLQRQSMADWSEKREREIERHAAQLAAREQELVAQETELRRQSTQWDEQRHNYQREIRRLLAELRKVDRPAAAAN